MLQPLACKPAGEATRPSEASGSCEWLPSSADGLISAPSMSSGQYCSATLHAARSCEALTWVWCHVYVPICSTLLACQGVSSKLLPLDSNTHSCSVQVQAAVRMCAARKTFLALRRAVLLCQATYRLGAARRAARRAQAAVTIQACAHTQFGY